MKQISGKMKFVFFIIAIILILGIAMILTKGFEKNILYSDHVRLEITLNDLEKEKVEEAIKEVFGNSATIQTVGDFEDTITISVQNLEENKRAELEEKLKEQNNGEEVEINQVEVGRINLRDIVIPYALPMGIVVILFAIYMGIKYYALPMGIVVILFAIYMGIKYRKKEMLKHIGIPVICFVLAEAIYACIFAIFRIPVGNYFMPLAVTVGIITLMISAICMERKKIK